MKINETTPTSSGIAADYIPRKQLAKELGERLRGRPYSEMTLIRWAQDGKGPPVTKIGREVVYSISSFEKWMRTQERKESAA